MTDAVKLKRYRAYRDSASNEMKSLCDIAIAAKSDKSKHTLLKIRYIEIEEIRTEFVKQHSSIIAALANDVNSNLDNEDQIKKSFFELYFETKTIYSDLFEDALNQSIAQTASSSHISTPNHVKLPKIELQTFTGDFRDFRSYIDLFDSLVHNNASLTNIEKFNYLISSLKDSPLALVQRLQMTSTNYPIAYKNLISEYNNTRMIAQSHWHDIDSFPKIADESANNIQKLIETFEQNLAALKNLNFPVDEWDFILAQMLLKKMTPSLVTRFELENASIKVTPSYESIIIFLNKNRSALDTIAMCTESTSDTHFKKHKKYSSKNSTPHNTQRKSFFTKEFHNVKCILCKGNHHLYSCSSFNNKSAQGKFTFAKENNLCTNCLSSMHTAKFCRSNSTCRICHKRHHTTLHMENNVNQMNETTTPSNRPDMPSTSAEIDLNVGKNYSLRAKKLPSPSYVLLGTFYVEVADKFGNYHKLRGLLDCGSQISVLSMKAANRLMLPKRKSSVQIQGLGETCANKSLGELLISIRPLSKNQKMNVDVVIVEKICSALPSLKFNVDNLEILKNISSNSLADPQFCNPAAVDLLLGADVFPHIITGQPIEFPGEPVALQTIFGYVLMGTLNPTIGIDNVAKTLFGSVKETESDISTTIKLLWETESVPVVSTISPDDKICEEMFINSYYRTEEGRFVVSLPFKNETPSFPGSKVIATHRFFALERRLLRQPQLSQDYCKFMQDYLDQGHMSIAHSISNENSYYIPHFSVLKEESPTTKLRVVFNASAKAENQLALNDCLYTGPKLQQDLRSILLRFRLHKVVFCTDIRQMYRNILINPNHFDYQRILWRFAPTDPIEEYILRTVTYGVSSSPYLALRTILELAKLESKNYPRAAKIISNDTYIDDVISGASSFESASSLADELVNLLKKAGIELRKWSSNDPRLLTKYPAEFLSTSPLAFEENSDTDCSVKVLGLLWNPVSDCFTFKVNTLNRPCTKRNMLSELARIFDPIGFLAPVTFSLKYFIQRLWLSGTGWDDSPDNEIIRSWNQYKIQLPLIENIQIPRILMNEAVPVEIHGFCDASEKGYAAVCYFRVKINSLYQIKFISAKSKIAPTKTLSIPKLELSAAVLLAKLLSWILETYRNQITIEKVVAWSDSAITLSWIKSSPHRWKTFVSNRVSYIQDKFVPSIWQHVPSQHNPADLASRGLLPEQLINNKFWFEGPPFLLSEILYVEQWSTPENLPEERKICLTSTAISNFLDVLLENHSTLHKIQRIVSYVQRFIHNCRYKVRNSDHLTKDELYNATISLVKHVQKVHFSEELMKNNFSKPLKKLNAFLDPLDVLRVGGRLNYSSYSYEKKHPALLPGKCRFTQLLIQDIHEKYFHAGINTIHYILSQSFWILSAKQIIRSVLSKCLVCWKKNPSNYQPPMGNLPISRISQLKPFSHSGVDYGGPIPITMVRNRGNRTVKSYICLFICLATKAVHIELATDLSTDSFLNALRRFISRRGRCSHLYSDCGTNFLGASKILKTLKDAASKEYIQWHFNPPSAAHFGGLWESGIKNVKLHLFKVIGSQILTYEELNTVLIQIEALLNSRPLSPQSSDPNDLSALTPGMFLTTEPLTALIEPDFVDVSVNRLNRWQLLQRLHQCFWQRWRKEYLSTLQQRSKWHDPAVPILPGTLVLIKNEATPPTQWPLARILEVHPGADGVARVATVKTAHGILTRPAVKLCPLPQQ